MNQVGTVSDRPLGAQSVNWSGLREEVRRHLERQGLPALQAEHCSHEVIVRCAAELEGAHPARLPERVMAEAETMLIGWRARHGSQVLAAA